ncbi:Low temperature viability protein [Penicillium griseofulvum]|uniref:Low temperature viability protein n=1 Tax=Penicillium patulum TaxID=5078 RepID=A0A135LLC1_PENPA|nr:Low temperature viability protein [Penicillium griseofulvum]KXG49745.1 Low temperature viability protein [Penicillium griseofulvum]
MPPKQWIDKKNASTFQLFHRSQNDPLIHDTSADDRFLYQVGGPAPAPAPAPSSVKTSKKPLPNLSDLQSEYGDSARKNEGEAANYGVYYDDSNYDYMQHLRELGSGTGDAYFVEAKTEKSKGRAGRGMKLEDALRQVSLVDKDTYQSASAGPSLYGSQYGDMRSTASSYVRKPTYQDQQNVPDAIAGFKPDMDPRLREALEALEDEAFVEDGDDDGIFDQLTANAEEIDEGDWEDSLFDDVEDEGWESDATEKAPVQPDSTKAERSFDDDLPEGPAKPPMDPSEMPEPDKPAPDMEPTDQSWMSEFAKFKKDAKAGNAPTPAAPTIAASQTMASTVFTAGGTPIRRKKRKGALTNPSAYSMTSSALARTAGHRLLDDRFDKVEQLYSLDEEDEYDDNMSMISGMTGATGMTGMSTASSQAPSLVDGNGDAVHSRSTFNNVMDDFLSSWDPNTSGQAKRHGAKHKRGKNGNEAIGIRMLDEVRSGLGPARIRGKGKVSGTA